MSLPHAFGTTMNNIPCKDVYLDVPVTRKKYWQRRLGEKTKPRVGIAWQGNPSHMNDYKRSIPLNAIIDDLSTNIEWISLQKYLKPQDLDLLNQHGNIHNFGEDIGDFLETGSLCANLDAVLSIDSSAAHLAGAIGKPSFLLLPHVADARWFQTRSNTPWYKNTTVYRQQSPFDWALPLKQAQSDIISQFMPIFE